jgi:hypothetical protein
VQPHTRTTAQDNAMGATSGRLQRLHARARGTLLGQHHTRHKAQQAKRPTLRQAPSDTSGPCSMNTRHRVQGRSNGHNHTYPPPPPCPLPKHMHKGQQPHSCWLPVRKGWQTMLLTMSKKAAQCSSELGMSVAHTPVLQQSNTTT